MKFDIDGLDHLQEGLQQVVQKGVNEINKGLDRINNPDAVNKESVPSVCPNCSAKLNLDKSKPVIKCEYCGTSFDNTQNKTLADNVFEFVEKQQKFAQEQHKINQEQERLRREEELLKAKLKAEKRKERFASGIFRRIVWLSLLAYGGYYYLQNKPYIDVQVMDLINSFMNH